jgi:hypothetical protein
MKGELRSWLLGWEGSERARVLDMYRELRSLWSWSPRSPTDLSRYVLPALEEAFERGTLIAVAVPMREITFDLKPLELPQVAPAPAAEPVDWVEIAVTDDEGEPYTGSYRVDLPDGRSLSGQLNMGGIVRLEGIASGKCKVVFPGIDVAAAEPE